MRQASNSYTTTVLTHRKIRYGKWTIPSVSDKTAMSLLSGEAGTMQNVKLNMKKPCEDCGLTLMQAGLEYADGTVANTDSGAWLHHIVLLMNGPNRKDVMCPFTPGQRFFSSGNERMMITYTDLENKKINSVYPMRKADSVFMQLELMNLKEEKKDVYITIDYEYMDKIPQGFKETKAVWLDVTGCGISSTSAPKGKSSFSMTSTKWTAPYDGQLLSTGIISPSQSQSHHHLTFPRRPSPRRWRKRPILPRQEANLQRKSHLFKSPTHEPKPSETKQSHSRRRTRKRGYASH